ncbi:hypothetical protein BC834DRAFT_895136 [Gloeopeniophorella convolvens]|nr:hypothetical protein BC834DRAFT_895136 [Gloeopeniophorella convolvens]
MTAHSCAASTVTDLELVRSSSYSCACFLALDDQEPHCLSTFCLGYHPAATATSHPRPTRVFPKSVTHHSPVLYAHVPFYPIIFPLFLVSCERHKNTDGRHNMAFLLRLCDECSLVYRSRSIVRASSSIEVGENVVAKVVQHLAYDGHGVLQLLVGVLPPHAPSD